MINPSKVIQTPNGTYFEGVCLSTDVKPVAGYVDGCVLTELNIGSGTVKTYRLDAANAQWVEVADKENELPPAAASDKGKYLHLNADTGALEWAEASGGGSGANVLKVGVSWGATGESSSLDRTVREILGADVVLIGSFSDSSVLNYQLLDAGDYDGESYWVKFAVFGYNYEATPPTPVIYAYSAFASSLDDYPVVDDSATETIPAT